MYEFLSVLAILVFCTVIIKLLVRDSGSDWEIKIGDKTIISIKKRNKS